MFHSSKKITFFVLTLCALQFSGQFSSVAHARQNWFDTLKGFFKQQIGTVDFNTDTDRTKNANPSRSTGRETDSPYIPSPTITNPTLSTDPSILRKGPTPSLPFRLNPAMAYDPLRQRYLVVWEQEPSIEMSEIRAQYYSREGVPQGEDLLVSTARSTQGCFYSGFHSDRPNLTVLSAENCQQARHPSVAFNNGKFLILWELGGTAPYAYNAHYSSEIRDGRSVLVRTEATPTENTEGEIFSNIIAKLVNADDTLSPANTAGHDNNWNEGILISGFNVSVNQDYVYNATTRTWDAFNPASAQDIDIQAWWVSKNPKVAALNRVGASDPTGFVVTWDSNRNFTDCREPSRRSSTGVFARYIDENFLGQIPSGTTNPNRPVLAISRDASGDPATTTDRRCNGDVQEAKNPKLAVVNSNDVVLTYESTTANFPAASSMPTRSPTRIGLKKLSFSNIQGASSENMSSEFGIIFPSTGTENQKNPDLLTYRNQIVLAYDDTRSLTLQKFNTTPTLTPACPMGMMTCTPVRLMLEGDIARSNPILGNNLGGSACPMAPAGMETACRPDTLGLNYLEAGNVKLVLLGADTNFGIARPPVNLSTASTDNIPGALASNGVDFFSAWTGVAALRMNIFTSATPTLEPLALPSLSMPNVGATLGSTTVDFSWVHPGGSGIQYTLQLAPMGMTLTDVPSCQNVSTTMCRVSSGLMFGQSYQWRIKAIDSRYTGRVVYSAETRSFSLAVDALPAPVLVRPITTPMDMPLTSNTVDFSWTHPGGAGIQYTLQMAPMGTDPVDVPTCQNITTTTCRITGLMWGQTYQWRVTARDTAMPLRTSISAETRTFTLIGTLAAPMLVSPDNAANLSMSSVTLQWTPMMARPGLVYDIFVDDITTTGMSTSFARQTGVSGNTALITGLLGSHDYRW